MTLSRVDYLDLFFGGKKTLLCVEVLSNQPPTASKRLCLEAVTRSALVRALDRILEIVGPLSHQLERVIALANAS